jgi:hypothetical protein
MQPPNVGLNPKAFGVILREMHMNMCEAVLPGWLHLFVFRKPLAALAALAAI